MSGRKKLGFVFYVSTPSQVKGVPTKKTIVNNFDYSADLVSLERINGESNIDFKKRIWDQTVNPGDASYEGIVNEIGRQLGVLREEGIVIELKLGSSGEPVAISPRVDILSNRVILYKDYNPTNPVIDKEIRTYKQGDDGYYLNDLISEINSSECFSAQIIDGVRANSFSSCLIRQSSSGRIPIDYLKADRLNNLDFGYLNKGTITFDEANIFVTEVSGEPSSAGEYNIDYTNGRITSYDTPSGERSCSYDYNIFPMEVDISPIQAFSFQDDNFRDELFEKKEHASGEELDSIPNNEGSEILHQLFMETKVFWGE